MIDRLPKSTVERLMVEARRVLVRVWRCGKETVRVWRRGKEAVRVQRCERETVKAVGGKVSLQ